MPDTTVQTYLFADDGRIPNNPTLPLLVYPQALRDADLVSALQARFTANGWGGIWVNGVYSYHHYHSTAHEVLGIARGTASIVFGGPQGRALDVSAGDVVVVPAGVGHCRVNASPDFRVVGAYPAGQTWDLRTGEPGERPHVLDNIRAVPLPRTDPVEGPNGPLLTLWPA
jgi:uncharacterized protein YjlB